MPSELALALGEQTLQDYSGGQFQGLTAGFGQDMNGSRSTGAALLRNRRQQVTAGLRNAECPDRGARFGEG